MVLTRSQSRSLAAKKEIDGNETLTPIKKETKTLSIEDDFVYTIKKMIYDHETIDVKNKNHQKEKVRTCLQIFEYVNKTIPQFKGNKRFNVFLKCVYAKCLSFEKDIAVGICDKVPYKLVCDIKRNIKKCKEIIINVLEIQV
jgi:hypothetical protein